MVSDFVPRISPFFSLPMLRYLKEAFWLRVRLPLLGALPANALALTGVGILGFAEHGLWLLGAGLEAAYLFALATNPRFQRVIAARDLVGRQAAGDRSHVELLAQLPPESRERLTRLEAKVARVATLLRADPDKDLLAESSLDALEKLAAVHARLLLAERHLHAARQETDPAALARQAAALERELNPAAATSLALSPALQESKQATLDLLRRRLANVQSRERSQAEVASDLARIEAQVDLALEEASLHGTRPADAGTHLNLLDDILASNAALGGSGTPDPASLVVPDAPEPPTSSRSPSAPPPLPGGPTPS